MARKTVALIGNYRSQNMGDDLYWYLLKKRYPNCRIAPLHKLDGVPIDYVILGGGGILRDDCARTRLARETAKKHRAPWCVLSCGSAAGGGVKFTDGSQYKTAEFITVRDDSATIIRRAERVPDLVWTYQPMPRSVRAGTYGIALRHTLRFNSLHVADNFNDILERECMSEHAIVMSTYGERIFWRAMPHVTSAYATSREYRVWDGRQTTIDEYVRGTFGVVEMVYAMPMHTIILAALHGVPVAGWSYSHKTDQLAHDLGIELPDQIGMYLPIKTVDTETVNRNVEEAERHYELLDQYLA